jgi:hypothetical protein
MLLSFWNLIIQHLKMKKNKNSRLFVHFLILKIIKQKFGDIMFEILRY